MYVNFETGKGRTKAVFPDGPKYFQKNLVNKKVETNFRQSPPLIKLWLAMYSFFNSFYSYLTNSLY
jgi:hypothetical protein